MWPTLGKAAKFVIKGMERAEEAKPISRSSILSPKAKQQCKKQRGI